MLLKIVLFLFSMHLVADNTGHRAGGIDGKYHFLPENSFLALEVSLSNLWSCEKAKKKRRKVEKWCENFHYLEFDIMETADNELIVFHNTGRRSFIPKFDQPITRMISLDDEENYEILNQARIRLELDDIMDIKIEQLSYQDEIRHLKLKGAHREKVPTFRKYFEMIVDIGVPRPILVEVKNIYSDKAREELLSVLKHASESLDPQVEIKIVAFNGAFRKSFALNQEMKDLWCKRAYEAGLGHLSQLPNEKKSYCNKELEGLEKSRN